jgi:hypothetical protein
VGSRANNFVQGETWGRWDSTKGRPDDDEEGGNLKRRKRALPLWNPLLPKLPMA